MERSKFIFKDTTGHNYLGFHPRRTLHEHDTRNRQQLMLPLPRSNVLKKSIFFDGIKTFNELPTGIKSCQSVPSFKYALKKHLLDQYSSL